MLDGECDRVHLLDELAAGRLGERRGARTGKEDAELVPRLIRKGREDRRDKLEDLFGLLRVVPLVVAPPRQLAGGRPWPTRPAQDPFA